MVVYFIHSHVIILLSYHICSYTPYMVIYPYVVIYYHILHILMHNVTIHKYGSRPVGTVLAVSHLVGV